jgi:hypothetical protein
MEKDICPLFQMKMDTSLLPEGGDKTSPPPLRGRVGWGKKIWRIKILWKIDHESAP